MISHSDNILVHPVKDPNHPDIAGKVMVIVTFKGGVVEVDVQGCVLRFNQSSGEFLGRAWRI